DGVVGYLDLDGGRRRRFAGACRSGDGYDVADIAVGVKHVVVVDGSDARVVDDPDDPRLRTVVQREVEGDVDRLAHDGDGAVGGRDLAVERGQVASVVRRDDDAPAHAAADPDAAGEAAGERGRAGI